MNLSKGQIAFAIIFFIGFVISMVYAYRKDIQKNKQYFKGTSFVLLTMIGVYMSFWLYVRLFG